MRKTGKGKQRQAKESEGKEEKKHNAINKEKEEDGDITESVRLTY